MATYAVNMIVYILMFLSIITKDVGGSAICWTKTDPEHIRIALRPTGVTISWTTCGYWDFWNLINDTPTPQVAYGTDPKVCDKLSSYNFTTSYNPYPIVKRFFHNVYLDNLDAGTKYYYKIQETEKCVRASSILSFTTAPLIINCELQPINISIVGDLGLNTYFNNYEAEQTIIAMKKYISISNFFMHIGDISYADLYGAIVNFDFYEDTWNRFQKAIEPITSIMPYQVLPGNHEATCLQLSDKVCPQHLKNFTAYNNRFHMSGELSGGYKNMWYSYDYGQAHIVMINTETDFKDAPSGPGTTLNAGNFLGIDSQLAWFEQDLIEANKPENRAERPWIIVAGHRPMFGSTSKAQVQIAGYPIIAPSDNCAACRDAFLPILCKYGVDFFMAGHVHWMELLYPLDCNGDVVANHFNNVDGVIHVTNGAGAAPTGAETVDTADMYRRAFFFGGYGFQQLEIKNCTHATLHFIDSSTKQIINSTDVVRSRSANNI
ncbi:unnamed protein product [Adineta steineri]|uniref:Purple acid phosphatase n=1 Tax=Adineta steineri TaxID=433720 RepID=A0A815EJ54_9BILA|nr:unnamed protein product [Adineta steineri]CAF1310703.1 unnamed protein product [Adineta steineri]